MSALVDLERAEDRHEQANERAKEVMLDLAEVNRCAYQGLNISETSRQLGMSREKVRYCRRVLKWDAWGLSPERGAAALALRCADI